MVTWSVVNLLVSQAACVDTSPRDLFEERVVPVLDRQCAAGACHGVAPGAEAAGEVVDWSLFHFEVDDRGHVSDIDGAYDAARRALGSDAEPALAPLLRKPLASAFGGLPHYGRDNFASPQDADYRTLLEWAAVEERVTPARPLDPLEALFAETVQPALISASCATGNCHGVAAPVPYHLDPGVGGTFGVTATRANYEQSLTMLALGGDPTQSRLLRKALPIHAGGILHKGGNSTSLTGPDDPRAEAIRAWACAEREARVGLACQAASDDAGAVIDGFVFVRGPLAPRDAFDLDTFAPGTDIFLARTGDASLVPTEVTNLTGPQHDGPADARDPAVDPTGSTLLFAMRLAGEEGHSIYELDLATGATERLTVGAGPLPGGGRWTDRDPTYGPDGRVWFVSTRAGVLADGGARLDADLYVLDRATGAITRRTFTPHIERKPVFFGTGHENGGEISFTALRDALPGQRRAHGFRFPPDMETEYHQHFGITPPEDLFYDTRELPDGRYVAVVGDLDGVWGGGRLAVIDRNFGPELAAGEAYSTAGFFGYAPPITRLDPDATASGVTGGLYRDPSALPDGRVLVAYADGPLDLSDPGASPDLRIEVVTLSERPDGSGPQILARAPLVDAPGLADRDPEPISVQASVQKGGGTPDPAATTGLLYHQGLPLIDALLRNLPPAGPKEPLTSLRWVRLVEALPVTPAGRQPIPTEETAHDVAGATTVSLSHHGPARVLAELPLAADGSFQAELPAGIPFRIQGLDADRMAVGAMHNRWFYVEPGQTLFQGVTDEAVYGTRCAGCHGAIDGDPAHAAVEPDAITTASLTLSRYEGQDSRRPLAPPLLGDQTRVVVDFETDVQPILDRACAIPGCHAGPDPAADLDLAATPTQHFNVAYESLLAPAGAEEEAVAGGAWVDAARGSAHRSPLMETLTGRELGAAAPAPRPGRVHPAPDAGVAPLSEQEMLTIVRWIDLGATWRGRVEVTP